MRIAIHQKKHTALVLGTFTLTLILSHMTQGFTSFLIPAAEAETTIVTPGSLSNWAFQLSGTASGNLVSGPAAPPMGTGSVQLHVGSNGDSGAQFRNSAFNNTQLSTITSLKYSTYVQGNTSCQAPYLVLNIDNDNNNTIDDTLFFEPCYQTATYSGSTVPNQGDVVLSTWQEWNAFTGGWWADSAGTNGPPLTTLANYASTHSGARIINSNTGSGGIRLIAGFGAGAWDNFMGNADAFTIGVNNVETTYDFEAGTAIGGTCSAFANSVTAFSQGERKNGSTVPASRSNPGRGLGSPNDTDNPPVFASLGFSGSITLHFNNDIINGSGADVRIYESTVADSYPLERAQVFASPDGTNWTEIGVADSSDNCDCERNTSDLDLGSLSTARYIRITDTTDPTIHDPEADAFDLNAVEAIHASCTAGSSLSSVSSLSSSASSLSASSISSMSSSLSSFISSSVSSSLLPSSISSSISSSASSLSSFISSSPSNLSSSSSISSMSSSLSSSPSSLSSSASSLSASSISSSASSLSSFISSSVSSLLLPSSISSSALSSSLSSSIVLPISSSSVSSYLSSSFSSRLPSSSSLSSSSFSSSPTSISSSAVSSIASSISSISSSISSVQSSLSSSASSISSPSSTSSSISSTLACIAPSTSGLIAHWPFDEGNGTAANDVVGNRDGTLMNMEPGDWEGAAPNSGLSTNPFSIDFDDVNEHIHVMGTGQIIGADNSFTIAGWIYMDDFISPQAPIYAEVSTGTADVRNYLAVNNNRRVYFDQSTPGGGSIESSTQLNEDEWYHVAYVQNGNDRYIYINGTLSAQDGNAKAYTGAAPDAVVIGGKPNTNPFYFSGNIDDLRIYNNSLNTGEISSLANKCAASSASSRSNASAHSGASSMSSSFANTSSSASSLIAGAPTCNGTIATVYVNAQNRIVGGSDNGDEYNGVLRGTTGNDIIVGTNDDDRIYGRSGNDIICGKEGDDEVDGGTGQDQIGGEMGEDELEGGNGQDIICGQEGDDELEGGNGPDQLDGGIDNDDLDGGNGPDTCRNGEDIDNCETSGAGNVAQCTALRSTIGNSTASTRSSLGSSIASSLSSISSSVNFMISSSFSSLSSILSSLTAY